MKSDDSFGLYLVPDDKSVFGSCESISSDVNWGGPHITMVGFHSSHKEPLIAALQDLQEAQVRWCPKESSITLSPRGGDSGQYNIDCEELHAVSKHLFLKKYGLNKVRDKWHVYLSKGYTGDKKILSKTKWSLMVIQLNGYRKEAVVKYLAETSKKF